MISSTCLPSDTCISRIHAMVICVYDAELVLVIV